LPATLVVGDPGDGSADFYISVDKPNGVALTKNHQGGMGTPLPDTIDVGDIVYSGSE
jgi:hypothetical protein